VNAGIHANVFAVAGHCVSSHRVSCVKVVNVDDSCFIMLPIKLAQAVTLHIFIQEVSGSNPGRCKDSVVG
jgi:hypothetical protein